MEYPDSLKTAQNLLALKWYGAKKDCIDLVKKAAATSEAGRVLNVDDYLPKNIEKNEETNCFRLDGQNYGLALRKTTEGDAIVTVSRIHMTEGIFITDGPRYSENRLIVGVGKNDISSDLNHDGRVTSEELNTLAKKSARENLHSALGLKEI